MVNMLQQMTTILSPLVQKIKHSFSLLVDQKARIVEALAVSP